MSSVAVCYLSPEGGVDDRIAGILDNGMSKEDIGNLRGLYDSQHEEPLISATDEGTPDKIGDKLLAAAKTLMQFKHDVAMRHLREMNDSTHHAAKTFSQLYHVEGWNADTRRNRINMVAYEFSRMVDKKVAAARKAGMQLTRQQVINGYMVDGQLRDGQFSIFESLFYKFLSDYDILKKDYDDKIKRFAPTQEKYDALPPQRKAYLDKLQHRMGEYLKVLNNWPAITTFARMSLRDTEGLKLGGTLNYAAPTTSDNFSMDSPLEETYDLEESVREAWMTHQAATSAFSSLGNEVRNFLSTIPEVDAFGEIVRDDMGYAVMMDPVETHMMLADMLRGLTSESAMLRKLREVGKTDPSVARIYWELGDAAGMARFIRATPQEKKAGKKDIRINRLDQPITDSNAPRNPIITQLLEDMHKNFIPYSAMVRSKNGDLVIKQLNRKDNPLRDEYKLLIGLNQRQEEFALTTVFDENGFVDWEKMADWFLASEYMLPSQETKADINLFLGGAVSYGDTGFWSKNTAERINYIRTAAGSLGIPISEQAARRILSNKKLRSKFLAALREFRVQATRALGTSKSAETVPGAYDILIKYRRKYGGNPSESSSSTSEEREEYRKALEFLNTYNDGQTMSFSRFIKKAYGFGANSKLGAGEERINTMLDVIGEATQNLKVERRVSWFDRKGKSNSRYSDRTPSYMGDLVDKIREFVNEKDEKGLKSFIRDKWGGSTIFYKDGRFLNRWLQELYDSIHTDKRGNVIIDENALAKVFQFDEFLGSNVDGRNVIFENFVERQHAVAMLKNFIQKRDQNSKSEFAQYPCFILGDAGTQMFFTARRYDKDSILKGMEDVFLQEIERMKYVEATNEILERNGYKPIANFSQTANEFTMMAFLNHTEHGGKYWKILTGNESMSNEAVASLSKEQAMAMAKKAYGRDSLRKAINAYMNDAEARFKDRLASYGILTKYVGNDGSVSYSTADDTFEGNLRHLKKEYPNGIEDLVSDFFWNTKYATTEQLQMFTVDPSFYSHDQTVEDLQKRYKEIYAPGKGLSLEARDYNGRLYTTRPYESVVYFDDIAVSSEDENPELMQLIEKVFGKDSRIAKSYKKDSLTDGQGYRTLDSYRAVRGMAGEWTQPMEKAYQRIKAIRAEASGRQLHASEVAEITELAVSFQPIKPFLYTLEKMQIGGGDFDFNTGRLIEPDYALIPVQHKYAEVVLIPEIMPQGKLRDMAIWMENHVDEDGKAAPIDLVCSTKCVKVGGFGSVDLKGKGSTEEIGAALGKAYVHNLSWSDYRIQSGVPEHMNHAHLFGTQIRKLVWAGIRKYGSYKAYLENVFGVASNDPNGPTVFIPGMGNVHLTGKNLISLVNSLIMSNIFDSYDNFAENTATNQALSDMLIQNVISNSNQSEDNAFALSLIDDGEFAGEFTVPLGEAGLEHDSFALLASLLKKGVNKQKIKGGMGVQASAMGLVGYQDSGDLHEVVSPDGDNVLYDEIELTWNLSYTAANGKNVPLKFEDWCYTEPTDDEYGHHEIGDLRMSDRLVTAKDTIEYLSWPALDKQGNQLKDSDGNLLYRVPLIETKYKGILDIVAYRIPTERDYSMINCKIKRFSHPLAGGILKVPQSGTTRAGFDFDIDKLHFFMREFKTKRLTPEKTAEIWSKVYGLQFDRDGKIIGGNEKYQALKAAQLRDQQAQELLVNLNRLFSFNAEKYAREQGLDTSGREGLSPLLAEAERLYDYWDAAGLEGSPEEEFAKYYNEFETYDPTVSPLNPVKDKDGKVVTPGNTRVARNNLLIDLIRQRLMDPETLKARYTPGGFRANSDAALRMRVLLYADPSEITDRNGLIDFDSVDAITKSINDGDLKDPKPRYDITDPTTILVYNQQNQLAAKLIGIFANQNANHAYASLLEEMYLRTPIKFGNHAAEGLSDFLNHPEGIDVDTNVAEYLSASVDAVKDPVLNYLNLNVITADAGAVLARLGYSPMEIGLLFNQPIIKAVCNYAANQGVSTENAILEISRRYLAYGRTFDDITYSPTNGTTNALANNLLTKRRIDAGEITPSSSYKEGQLQVLALFNEILAATGDVSSFVQSTRFTAANSIGSTEGDFIAQEQRVKKFIDKYASNDEQSLKRQKIVFKLYSESDSARVTTLDEEMSEGDTRGILNMGEYLLDLSHEEYLAEMSRNPLAFEQCMMDAIRKAERDIFSRQYPYRTQLYKTVRNIIGGLTKYGTLDADTINSIHRDLMVYLLSIQDGTQFDGKAIATTTNADGTVSNREFYTKYFPQLIAKLKSEGALKDAPFFRSLTIVGDAESKQPLQLRMEGVGGLQTRASNLITEEWADAFVHDRTIVSGAMGRSYSLSELAKDMFLYNFYRMGFNFHPTSTMSLTPTVLKLGLTMDKVNRQNESGQDGYIDFVRRVIGGKVQLTDAEIYSFVKQYLLNHLDNKRLVFTPKGRTLEKVLSQAYSEETGWNMSFTVNESLVGKDMVKLFTLSRENGVTSFRPVVAVTHGRSTAYYMADGSDEAFNTVSSAKGTMTYRFVSEQGERGKSLQYFGASEYRSFQGIKDSPVEADLSTEASPDSAPMEVGESSDGVSFVQVREGDNVQSMFSDSQWQQIFNGFRALYPSSIDPAETWTDFRSRFTEGVDKTTADVLNEITEKVDRNEVPPTIDENGNEIPMCPVK